MRQVPLITEEERATFGLSVEQAKALTQGATLNCINWGFENRIVCDASGEPSRYKVTSVQVWKRSPERVRIGVKRGLREFATFTEADLRRLRIA